MLYLKTAWPLQHKYLYIQLIVYIIFFGIYINVQENILIYHDIVFNNYYKVFYFYDNIIIN